MGRTFSPERAEQEANKIGLEFAHSNDVMKDMSRAYNVDFSNIRVHTDSAADNKVKAAGKDALAQGNDIFFGKGIFESNDPADKGLVAHEFAHTMQQGAAMGGEMAVAESAPMGVAQGGFRSWFKGLFGKKKEERPIEMQNMDVNDYSAYALERKVSGMDEDEDLFTGRKGVDFGNEHITYNENMLNMSSYLMQLAYKSSAEKGTVANMQDAFDNEITEMEEMREKHAESRKAYGFYGDAIDFLRVLPQMAEMYDRDNESIPEDFIPIVQDYKALEEQLKKL